MANLFTRITRFLSGKQNQQIKGSQIPLNIGSRRLSQTSFELPYRPLRPVNGSLENAYELLEIAEWCYEAKHTASIIARDCFQSLEGKVDAWYVTPQVEDGKEIPLNPELLLIANNLKNRCFEKTLIIGGNRLEKAARELLLYGDCFLELGFDKDESGKLFINRSNYLPTYQMFVDEDYQGSILCYRQQSEIRAKDDDIEIPHFKVLHFQYEKGLIYGRSINQQSIETWRKLKNASADVEEAARAVGVSPWLHIMPEDRAGDLEYKAGYRLEHQSLLRDGIITNLYLEHGADVRKAETGDTNLDSMLNYWVDLRKQMIPPGMPLWLFPGLMADEKSGQDLQGQPALNYQRKIAYIRSILGEQIKWAIKLEVVLQKGHDWLLDHGQFDIGWGQWQSSVNQSQEDPSEEPSEELDNDE